jgi:mono/diheme cytochrome c family protein
MPQTRVGLFQPVARVAGSFGGAALLLAVAATPVAGQPAVASAGVTYAKDIAPVFQRSCQQCHQPDSVGPMSLVTYQQVRPWARAIKQKVVAGEMPPYRYDRNAASSG